MEIQADKVENIGEILLSEFQTVEKLRQPFEDLWLKDLRQYKGQYDPEVLANIGTNRSTVNIRQTKIKVDSISSKCLDLLFPATGEANWDIGTTPIPKLAPHIEQKLRQDLVARIPDADEEDFNAVLKEHAKITSEKMRKEIKDQLVEKPGRISYRETAKRVIRSGLKYGTGILKGPLVTVEERKSWGLGEDQETGQKKWMMERVEGEITPFYEFVQIWDFYPDMSVADLKNCSFVWQAHIKDQADLLELAMRKDFKGDKIRQYIKENPKGSAVAKNHEQQLRMMSEDASQSPQLEGKFRVMERWGFLTGVQLKDAGISINPENEIEVFYSNIWILDNVVIKAVLAPVKGAEMPYHLFYFDKDETCIFGDSLPTIIRDPVKAYNAATRGMLDHAAITAGPQISYNASALRAGTDIEIYPFKLWPFEDTDDMDKAFKVWDLSNHMSEYVALTQFFRDVIDELSTPRFMQGQGDVGGAGDTAHGLSMLMGAANVNLKEIIKTYDDGITQPFISGMYHWNMQFNKKEEIKGDFDVVALGSSSLIAKELYADKLMNAAKVTDSPRFQPKIKDDMLLKEVFKALELNADLIRTEEEQAEWDKKQMIMQAEANITVLMAEAEKRGLDPGMMIQNLMAQSVAQMNAAQGQEVVA